MRKACCHLPDIAGEFELVPSRRTLGLAAEAAETSWNVGLKPNARPFPIVAHIDTGLDLLSRVTSYTGLVPQDDEIENSDCDD